jgi:glycosyltransferase involved in cell wall biosynthesis
MRVNWFSPLPPAKTGIAEYTGQVLPVLSAAAQVTLWADQKGWDAGLEGFAEVRHFTFDTIPWAIVNRADVTIYHMGNNPHFHKDIWRISRLHPGYVILHDVRLQHLFLGLFRDHWQDRQGYLAQMEHYYGEPGFQAGQAAWEGGISVESLAERFALYPLALENSLGVVVHTAEALEQLRREQKKPVLYAPLPYPAAASSPKRVVPGTGAPGQRYRLVVFGHIGPNRRLNELLEALAAFPQKDAFHLDVFGQIASADATRKRIRQLGMEGMVTLHGFVSDEKLDAALASAHLAINLRYPVMGEASISQLRIWRHGLPSLVTRTGWYASIPEEAAAFVRVENENADIQAHLLAFLEDPARFLRIGESGRRILEGVHSPETYVASIVKFVAGASRRQRWATACTLAERAGTAMSPWTVRGTADEVFRKPAEEVCALVL